MTQAQQLANLSQAFTAGSLSPRNLIINPHGSIFQESGAAITVPAGGGYFVDQWFASRASSTGALQAGGTPSTLSDYDTQAIFIKTTTAQASLAANDYAVITQPVEGYYHRHLLYGTAAAKGSWIRFRAVCTQSATCSLAIRNLATNRSWVQTFAASDTPRDYAFFIPGDTTGTWPTGNTAGAYVTFCFASGTTYQTATLGAWQAGSFFAGTAQTNLMGTLNAQLTITDVQWSRGDFLMPFQPIDYTEELLRCQRYFLAYDASTFVGMGMAYGTNGAYIDIRTPVAMRGAPSITTTGSLQLLSGGGAVAFSAVNNVYWNPSYGVNAQIVTTGGTLAVGDGTAFYTSTGRCFVNARM